MSLNGAQRCRCQCHWDLSWLQFGPTRIGAGDVDGLFVVERGCRFLFIETKRPDELVTRGQEILLTSLSLVPEFTVVVLRGPRSFPETMQRITRGHWGEYEPADRAQFQDRVAAWYEYANSIYQGRRRP